MRATLVVHIVAGALALVAGYVALYSAKGARLHRRSGMLFVYAILMVCVAGVTIAAAATSPPRSTFPPAC